MNITYPTGNIAILTCTDGEGGSNHSFVKIFDDAGVLVGSMNPAAGINWCLPTKFKSGISTEGQLGVVNVEFDFSSVDYDTTAVFGIRSTQAYVQYGGDATCLRVEQAGGTLGDINAANVQINSTRVLTSRQAAIPDSTGTLIDDTRAINAALAMLRVHGLIST